MKKDLEKTLTEIEQSKYKKISPIRISNKAASLMAAAFVVLLLFSAFDRTPVVVVPKLKAEDGAGTYWRCGNCGASNKCYEMSCSNCGSWR